MPRVEKQTTATKAKPKAAPATGVLARIKPISEDRDPSIKIMLYGRSGSGKTSLWSTFPKPILAMVCSGGNQLGELKSIDTPENADTIFRVAINESSEIRTVLDHVAENGGYATIVLDHASGLQDLILKEILGVDQLPAQSSWGMASQQQYGQCILQSKEILRALLKSTANVVVVAQERAFNTEEDGKGGSSDVLKPYVAAGLSPSLSSWLNTGVDYICQCFIRQKEVIRKTSVAGKTVEKVEKTKGVEFCLRCAPHETYMTKFRLPKKNSLPESIVDPDYEKIVNTIIGE